MNDKILVTGAHGFVGRRIMEHNPAAVAVPSELLRGSLDRLADFVRAEHPAVILNAAAISDISACAKDPDGSYRANVQLPVRLAAAARDIGAKLISFSSDQVYTGCTADGPYREDDPLPTPANLYARHKLEAEVRVLDLAPDAVLLRATWMYDMPVYGHANRGNFLVGVLRAVQQGKPMTFSDREYRGITYVRQVAALLDQAARLPGGVYNYGSENTLSMLETARSLLSALGLDAAAGSLLSCRDEAGHNLWMDCGKLIQNGVCFDTTAEGFRRCAADYALTAE